MKDIAVLNSLIETLKDGQEGFREAGEDAQAGELKTTFSQYAIQRANFATQLQSVAQQLGETSPPDEGSWAGALHRGWINLKSAIASRNAHTILAECERGEDSAVATYKEALAEQDLQPNVRNVIASQYTEIQAAHDHIRDLRDSMTGQ